MDSEVVCSFIWPHCTGGVPKVSGCVAMAEFSDGVFGLLLPPAYFLKVRRSRLRVQRGCGLEPQWETRSMKHYAGLDVSVEETSVCILDETGRICREVKVTSHPEDLLRILQDPIWHFERIGLEAGQLSRCLLDARADAALLVFCTKTRHAKAFLKAQVNKSDRNDARGIAQMMRVNLFRPVHVKTLTSQKRRGLLTARKHLPEKAVALGEDNRGPLVDFGLQGGGVGGG